MKNLIAACGAVIVATVGLLAAPTAMAAEEARTVTGIVTQVRPASRVLRVMDGTTRQRHNYTIPSAARITIDGRERSLRQIERGQQVTLRYRITSEGRVVETVRVPEPTVIVEVPPEPTPVASIPDRLPKTAGPLGMLLLLGGLFAGAALVIGRVRARA